MALTKGLLLRSLSVAGFQSTKLTSQLVVPATPLVVQAATITRGPKKWPKYPFPYKRLRYRMCYRLFWRGNGNLVPNESKVIVVDGNAAVGKSEFAKELAERLDFKMFDEPEELFSRYYTWAGQPDDPKAMSPKDAQTYHFPQFFSDPGRNRGACIGLQLELFKLRYFHYCKALNHLYSTGQGVVLVRSPFSDRAFVETYFDLGLLPGADWRREFEMFQWRILDDIPTPHLTIYLDAPLNHLIDRIKERQLPFEVDNLEFTKEFIGMLDYWYKRAMLPYYEFHGRLLSYSWDQVHDWNGILEDIEAQDLEDVFNHKRFKNWKCPENDYHAELWSFYSNKRLQVKLFQRYVDRLHFTAGSLWGTDTVDSSKWLPNEEVVRKIS